MMSKRDQLLEQLAKRQQNNIEDMIEEIYFELDKLNQEEVA